MDSISAAAGGGGGVGKHEAFYWPIYVLVTLLFGLCCAIGSFALYGKLRIEEELLEISAMQQQQQHQPQPQQESYSPQQQYYTPPPPPSPPAPTNTYYAPVEYGYNQYAAPSNQWQPRNGARTSVSQQQQQQPNTPAMGIAPRRIIVDGNRNGSLSRTQMPLPLDSPAQLEAALSGGGGSSSPP